MPYNSIIGNTSVLEQLYTRVPSSYDPFPPKLRLATLLFSPLAKNYMRSVFRELNHVAHTQIWYFLKRNFHDNNLS